MPKGDKPYHTPRLITRREFVASGAVGTGLAAGISPVFGQAPAIRAGGVKAVVIASDDGLHDRGGPEHRPLPGAVARMEASHGSRTLPRSEKARAGVVRRRTADGPRRPDRSRALPRHHQHERHYGERRAVRCYLDERP